MGSVTGCLEPPTEAEELRPPPHAAPPAPPVPSARTFTIALQTGGGALGVHLLQKGGKARPLLRKLALTFRSLQGSW